MATFPIQATFSRGEISPKLLSRTDIQDWRMALSELTNFTVLRQGGLQRRPGTTFIGELKTSTAPGKLIPFIYNNTQSYVLAFNDGTFRVYTLGGRVSGVDVAHGYSNTDIQTLDWDQTNDVLDITHANYKARRVTRNTNSSWSIADTPFKYGPYLTVNDTITSMTPSDTGNAVPQMTSATAPSGTCDASATTSPGVVWYPWDRDSSTPWYSGAGTTGWISYTYAAGNAKVIVGYTVVCTNALITGQTQTDRAPKSWTFEGSNDGGTTWTTLDSQFAQTEWSEGEARYFEFNNATAYLGYRLNITSNNGGAYVAIGNVFFTEAFANEAAITITASSVAGINKGTGFTSSDIGRTVALLGTDEVYHAFVIQSIISSTVVTAKLDDGALPKAQTTMQWKLGAWGVTPGYPAHVATFEGRKVFGRTNLEPQGLWGTQSGGYGSFLNFRVTNPIQDDDAIMFKFADSNEISWIAEGSDLMVGTMGAARTMGRDSPNLPFSATNFRQSKVADYGSQDARPAKVGTEVIFTSSFGKALRVFTANPNGPGYDTPDISIKSEHLYASGIVEMAYAQEPSSIVWVPNKKGELIGLTYEKAQDMAGFHRHRMGGNGFVENVCVIPSTTSGRSELWLIVRRTINGVTKRYIELMAAPFDPEQDDPTDAIHLDCSLTYQGTAVTTVTGLSHLEGMTVSIYADGTREQDQVVSGGSVTLASGRPATKITVGLPFTSTATTLPATMSAGDGSSLGRKHKNVFAIVDLYGAGSLKVGEPGKQLEELVKRKTTDPLGQAVPLVSGPVRARFESTWNNQGLFTMVADGPFPCIIRSLTLAQENEP